MCLFEDLMADAVFCGIVELWNRLGLTHVG